MTPLVQYARSGDCYIAYRTFGSGPVELLWYPGAPMLPMESIDDEPSFVRVRDRLASFARVVQFDARGVGLSDPSPSGAPPSVDQWVDDAVAVLGDLGLGPVAVLAPRESALQAVRLAALHPERVARLIIVNGFARLRRADDYPVGVPNHLLDALLESMTTPNADAAGSDLLGMLAPSVATDPAFRAWWDRAGRQGASPATARTVLRVSYDADVRALLPQVQAPTLVLHYRDEPNFRIGHGRYLAEHIPGARLVELDGRDSLYWVGDTAALMDEVEEFLTGSRQGPSAGRVLAAILFTDIVDSTGHLSRVGERAWHTLLDRYDNVVRRQLQRFSGREVKNTGDGTLALFDSPTRAVLCASAIRADMAELQVRIRAGIHVGEVDVRGADVSGMAVHIAARIQALAAPDDIMVSRTLVELTIGTGIAATPAGEHNLKGVPIPVTVFRIGA